MIEANKYRKEKLTHMLKSQRQGDKSKKITITPLGNAPFISTRCMVISN